MNLLVIEDEQVGQLAPITLSRPAFAVSCGSFRLIDRLSLLAEKVRCLVRPHLQAIVELDFPPAEFDDSQSTLVVNARLVPSVAVLGQLAQLILAGVPGVVRVGDTLAAALVTSESTAGLACSGTLSSGGDVEKYIETLELSELAAELPLFEWPHDVIRFHESIMADNLALRIAEGEYQQKAGGVFLAEGATIGLQTVTDTTNGPIVLEAGATVGPQCFLSGPLHIGPGARIVEQASIKDHVALGHTTKIGGEVSHSIVEPYSNKTHHGYLGHSYLGSWVNLGAGTCNSNLKNTYGEINMNYAGTRVATGMQFMGCVVGDFSKSAINTSIFTGKTIGVGSMLYGFVTKDVPSFVNFARSFGQISEVPPEVMATVQARTFARRGITQRECDKELITAMHQMTQTDRDSLDEPFSDGPLTL